MTMRESMDRRSRLTLKAFSSVREQDLKTPLTPAPFAVRQGMVCRYVRLRRTVGWVNPHNALDAGRAGPLALHSNQDLSLHGREL